MAEIIIPSFIQNYMNEIHEPAATKQFVKLAGDYQQRVEDIHNSAPNKAASAKMMEEATGKKTEINLQDDLKKLEQDTKMKARDIAKEYIKDENELNRINPEIQVEPQDGDKNITALQDKAQKSMNPDKEARREQFKQQYGQGNQEDKTATLTQDAQQENNEAKRPEDSKQQKQGNTQSDKEKVREKFRQQFRESGDSKTRQQNQSLER